MAAPSSRPIGKFRFLVEIDGLTVAHFQSVSGLKHEIEVLEQAEGGINDRVHKLPGAGTYPNISLKVGYIVDRTLEQWHQDFVRAPGETGRKSGSIVLLGDDGTEVARWNFVRAWPVKWEGPEFDGSQGQIHVESVEIAHEGIRPG